LVEYVFFSRAFDCFSDETMKILDTHDVFAGRQKLYSSNGLSPVFYYTTQREESRALDRANLILAIQTEEATYFSKMTKQKVVTVGHMVQIPGTEEVIGKGPHRLLFVGSANHINIDGLNWFLGTVFPQLRKKIPTIELDVVGSCAAKIPSSAGVNLVGPVTELARYYNRANVVINPLRFGTGLKIKTIEALAHGKPLVTTSTGSAGLEDENGKSLLVANTPEDFSGKVLQLLSSSALCHEISGKAHQYVQSYNKNVLAPLLKVLK
jgi:glycosyltransferase involved in cell wall biosynthesis